MIGIPASGKTTFYTDRFVHTHLRLSLDVLRTRKRESELFEACLRLKQPVVIDNTNVSRGERARFIAPARMVGFSVVGYLFEADLGACLARNSKRLGKGRIRDAGVVAALERFEPPVLNEGFDAIHSVQLSPKGFKVFKNRVLQPIRSTDSSAKVMPTHPVGAVRRIRPG